MKYIAFIAIFLLAATFFGFAQQPAPSAQTTPPAAPKPAAGAETSAANTPGATKVNPKDGLTYVWIPPGKFKMGCAPGDNDCGDDEKPQHEVTLTKGFWIGQTPVTQAAYQKVQSNNPSRFKGDKLPAENMSWSDASAYCAAVGLRLPTEAEWEYAARAGDPNPAYSKLDDIAWYNVNSKSTTHPVATKKPNAWKLYDMLGNVCEWTADPYDKNYYQHSEAQDPKGNPNGVDKAIRGGSWNNSADIVRASQRLSSEPDSHGANLGFRCAGNEM